MSYDDGYPGPHRASQFDTMNLGEPHRATAPPQFDTRNLGPGPQRVAQFDTVNLGAPVRVPDNPAPTDSYVNTGGTPMNPAASVTVPREKADNSKYGRGLAIASVAVSAAAAVSLLIALAVIAADSVTISGVTVSYSDFSSFKYALAVAIIGTVYATYRTVSSGVRLGTGHRLLPGTASLFVPYIGDQVMNVLLLTGGSAMAATLKDLHDLDLTGNGTSVCDGLGSFCGQGAGGVAMIFLGFAFLAASLVISSFCFFKNKT